MFVNLVFFRVGVEVDDFSLGVFGRKFSNLLRFRVDFSSGSEEKLRFAVNTDGSSDEKTTEQTSESSGLKSDKLNSQTK